MLIKDIESTLSTGFNGFDLITGGLRAGELVLLAARPGMGKSAFIETLVNQVTAGNENVTTIFSLEISEEELFKRFLSNLSQVHLKLIKSLDLDEKEFKRVLNASEILRASKIIIDDSKAMTTEEIKRKSTTLKKNYNRLDLVIIDSLQLVHTRTTFPQNRENEIASIVSDLKNLAVALNVPIIVLSQIAIGLESRENKRPVLSDIVTAREAILEKIDLILFLYRASYYCESNEQDQIAEIIVAQNKSGQIGTVPLKWDESLLLFRNL